MIDPQTDLKQLEARHTSGVYGKRDLMIVRGAGARVWDEAGKAYIDCAAGIGVANIGHCHPTLVQALSEQANTLLTCPEMFYNNQRATLLARLSEKLPDGLERIFLCNSGTEAVEAAIKFARASTGKPGVVAAMRGFHGRTLGSLSATHNKEYRQPFVPLVPGFSHVPYDNIERLEAALTDETAAVILEIVQGESGVRPGSPEYFQAVRQMCDERGILLIIDEVQTGFGRTGCWFACEHARIIPDLLALGKSIAGGVPMGAVALGPKVMELKPGMHGSTFGGNPLACAAALAVLDIYKQEDLVTKARESGAYLLEQLAEIDSPLVREVRGLGLMAGMELRVRVHPLIDALTERGVIALLAGSTVLRLLPPLAISRSDLDTVVTAIGDSLATLEQEANA
ncbi:MAG: aspartate aminotransferase family protein [Anaerolineales bacterium]|nr:aspartate aminotransferase family protein [Anaerolineales bacterium]